ncbi:MAG: cell division protein FtsA [Alphaproteobacteria bacterium]|nr:cell division protein FtsA [Alphaproteobacteria bacterium]
MVNQINLPKQANNGLGNHLPKKNSKPVNRQGVLAALDIGTNKICCLIAQADDEHRMRILGIGHHMSRGLRNGSIVNMEETQLAVINAVHDAEKSAGVTVQKVLVNLSGGYPNSQTVKLEADVNGQEISDKDLRRILEQGSLTGHHLERRLIHSIPVGYSLDGNRGIRDPRGMFGQRLAVDMHLVTAAVSAVRNLTSCISRCHLGLGSIVVSSYASGLATLVDDEIDLGVTVIDMGAGTTNIAVFFDGNLVYTDCLPIGGNHVTNDIARGLSTPLAEAERIKTLYGHCIPSTVDQHEIIHVPQIGENDPQHTHQVSRSILVGIIQPRLEETFELVRSHLEISGFDKLSGRRVVLTGGASQLGGVKDLARLILNKQVRLGRPIGVLGLDDVTAGPAFATCTGLLAYGQQHNVTSHRTDTIKNADNNGFLSKISHWLRENF